MESILVKPSAPINDRTPVIFFSVADQPVTLKSSFLSFSAVADPRVPRPKIPMSICFASSLSLS